jgi:hypothetical protein
MENKNWDISEAKNYFTELNKINCETSEKNKLTYISWSDAWTEVKKMYPDSNYTIYENEQGFPFWESKFGIDCKVWVTINWIEHIVRLPVMNWANKAMKADSYTYMKKGWNWAADIEVTVEAATQFDINKTTQRAFAKAIAMHGIWLYVFRWEDLPEDMEWENVEKKDTTKNTNKVNKDLYTLTNKDVEQWNGKIYAWNSVYVDWEKKTISNEQVNKLKALDKYISE